MGVSKAQVERMLDLDHASRLDQIESAFKASISNLRSTHSRRGVAAPPDYN
jgi:hypothetical protein